MGRAYGGEKIEICGNPAISGVRSRCLPNAGDDDWEQGSIKVKNIYRTGEFSHNYVRQPKAYRFCRYNKHETKKSQSRLEEIRKETLSPSGFFSEKYCKPMGMHYVCIRV